MLANNIFRKSSFKRLLEKDGSVSANNRNVQILTTEMYKIKNDLTPLIVTGISNKEIFEQWDGQHHDLRKNSQVTIPPIRTVYHGSEIISFLGPKIWNILQDMLENTNSIEVFEMQMKQLKS